MKRTTLRAVMPLLVLACAWACDAPTEATKLEVEMSSNPDPATASGPTGVSYRVTNSDDTVSTYEYDWRTSFVVTIRETGGRALTITATSLQVQQAAGGIVVPPSGGDQVYFRFNTSASGNQINGGGSASVGFEVFYDLPNQGKEALVTVSFTFDDDDNNSYGDSIQVKVAP